MKGKNIQNLTKKQSQFEAKSHFFIALGQETTTDLIHINKKMLGWRIDQTALSQGWKASTSL